MWQDIKTAPTDGTHILACCSEYDNDPDFITEVWWKEWNDEIWEHVDETTQKLRKEVVGCWKNGHEEYMNPTHWMPLPSPPRHPRIAKTIKYRVRDQNGQR